MTTILNGLVGGLVAAAATELLARAVGVTAAAIGGREPDGEATGKSRLRGTAVRLAYGSLAGGALVALELYLLGVLAVPPGVGEALLVSVGWSVLLFVLVAGLRVGARARPDSTVGTLALHLVFGVALGLWIRLTWIT